MQVVSRRRLLVAASALATSGLLPRKAAAIYTTKSLADGTVRYLGLPVPLNQGVHCFLMGYNGGGLLLRNPNTGALHLHQIPFNPTIGGPYTQNLDSCVIDGVPNQVMPQGKVYDAFAYDDGNGNVLVEFSQTAATLDQDALAVKQGDTNKRLVGRVGRLTDGSVGYPGGPTCGMVCSYFHPEKMSLVTYVGGSAVPADNWKELCTETGKIHFTCFGDGREPHVHFWGQVSNSVAGQQTFVGLSFNGADPSFTDAGGGVVMVASSGVSGACGMAGAAFGEAVDTSVTPAVPIQYHIGLKMNVPGGAGSLPWSGKIVADIWM